MAKRSERSAAKEQYWREVIDGWRRSGGSVRQWCTQRQISEPSFYFWRKTLAKRDAAAAPTPPVRRKVRRKRAPAAMIPVEIVPSSNQPQSAPPEITLGGDIHLLVRAHCQPALLRETLAALRAAEQHLMTTLSPEKGRDLLKQVRAQLIEIARPALETLVQELPT